MIGEKVPGEKKKRAAVEMAGGFVSFAMMVVLQLRFRG